MSIASSNYFVWLTLILKIHVRPRRAWNRRCYSLDLPDAIMDPLPPCVQEELNTSGDNIQTLRGEIREAELEAQKKRPVDTFYKEVNRAYGLCPDSIDYDQFRIDDDGKRSTGRLATKRSRLVRRGEEFGSWRYQHWPRGTGWVVQMHCGDRWDSLVTRGKSG